MTELVRQDAATEIAIQTVLDSLDSPHSRRAYERHLRVFIAWHQASGHPGLTKAVVQRYAAELREAGLSAATINQRLSAIRKLAEEAADNGALDAQIANGIRAIKGIRHDGRSTGNWLTTGDAQSLIDAPGTDTLRGLRNRAILCVLIGCGLRRAEAANLAFDHIQQRDGRWVLVDLIGKGNKLRSVPMPNWTKAAIDAFTNAADLTTGKVFRSINRGSRLTGVGMTDQAIYIIVIECAKALDLGDIAPHDLRRTFAKLAHKGGARLDQIQLSLGHSSIQTTERYLGTEQDLTDAPCDRLGLRL
ncbi:MAG: hypothetical protein QOD75_130 [Blastocatellia bacterium]|nr:hypothetical protein [Blastocatellia bacterium]